MSVVFLGKKNRFIVYCEYEEQPYQKKKKLSDGKHFHIRKGSIYIKAVKGKKKKILQSINAK